MPVVMTLNELCKEIREDLMMTVSEWYYCGSKEAYHYFYNIETGFDSGTYRIKSNELRLIQTFPFTQNRSEWILLLWRSPFPGNRNRTQVIVDNDQDCFSLFTIVPKHNIILIIDNNANSADANSSAAD
jgi:hypothetical protein